MTYEIINPTGRANIVFICEHASNFIPPEFNKLGLSDEQLELHIAWDIGIANVTRNLATMLDAPAILACFSRLLIDANRALDQEGLISETSDGHIISGNQNLSLDELNRRINGFYIPFHKATTDLIKNKSTHDEAPLIFNMHSFTPKMNKQLRKWHTGMLWNKDPRLAKALINKLNQRDMIVGDNEPYSGRSLNHTMNTHGSKHGFPHVNIEIRQDEIDHNQGVEKWCDILSDEIRAIRNLPEMAYIKHY